MTVTREEFQQWHDGQWKHRKMTASAWLRQTHELDKGHKHHYGKPGRRNYHKGFCYDDHQTDGRWRCDACQRNHHGPLGKDFLMGGALSGRTVDLYLKINASEVN
jgi:hypothetical protein